MEIYLKLVDVFFPVFLVIGIGFYFGKKNPKFDTDFITKLTGTFGTPALIFYSLTSTGVNLETFIEFFTYKIIMVSDFAFCNAFFPKNSILLFRLTYLSNPHSKGLSLLSISLP